MRLLLHAHELGREHPRIYEQDAEAIPREGRAVVLEDRRWIVRSVAYETHAGKLIPVVALDPERLIPK